MLGSGCHTYVSLLQFCGPLSRCLAWPCVPGCHTWHACGLGAALVQAHMYTGHTGKAAMLHQQGKHSECVDGGCLGQQGTAAELVAVQVGCCLCKVPSSRGGGCAATCCSDSITRRAVLMLVAAGKAAAVVLCVCAGACCTTAVYRRSVCCINCVWVAPWRPHCNNSVPCKSQHGTVQGCQLTCTTEHCVLCCNQAHRMVFTLSQTGSSQGTERLRQRCLQPLAP